MLSRLLESVINRWIGESAAAQAELDRLEGRSMHVAIDGTGMQARLHCTERRLLITSVRGPATAADTATVRLQAGAAQLLALMRADNASQLAAGQVEFRGDLRVAQGFARLLQLARPEFEDELAGWIGGMPAHGVARAVREATRFGRQAARAAERDVSEYLRYETHTLPLKSAQEEFARGVEDMRDDVGRIEQRIASLGTRPG